MLFNKSHIELFSKSKIGETEFFKVTNERWQALRTLSNDNQYLLDLDTHFINAWPNEYVVIPRSKIASIFTFAKLIDRMSEYEIQVFPGINSLFLPDETELIRLKLIL